jgi:hypothetical protein
MNLPVKTLEANTVGRDFVIGDLHGSYSIFCNLLANINFDATKDRIVSTADLCDRGPQSLACLMLLHEPWFYCIISNHEKMMLSAFENSGLTYIWWANGGTWAMTACNDYVNKEHRIPAEDSVRLFELLPIVEKLPYLITIKTKSGKKFHVIHAEFLTNKEVTDEMLEDPVEVHRLATVKHYEGDAILWSRAVFNPLREYTPQNKNKIARIINYNKKSYIYNDKLSHIISGHTILKHPMTILGQTNIDTGAYNSYSTNVNGIVTPGDKNAALTCIELDTWKFYQATETTFKEVDPIVISKDDIS